MINTSSKWSRLRDWRVHSGLSLAEISDLSGYSVAMLSRVERGEREMAPMSKVRLARSLSVRVADLFEVEPAEGDQ